MGFSNAHFPSPWHLEHCTTGAAVRAVLQVEDEDSLEQLGPTQPHRAVVRQHTMFAKRGSAHFAQQSYAATKADQVQQHWADHPKGWIGRVHRGKAVVPMLMAKLTLL